MPKAKVAVKKITKKTAKKVAPVAPKSQNVTGISAEVYSLSGKVIGKEALPKEIFDQKINKVLISQAVRVHLLNQKKNLASTKTRGEVRGGGKKPWKQKGTGRARIGSIRAPHWIGGGIVFGPRPKDVELKLTKKMKRAALFSALSDKAKEGKIIIVEGLEKIEPKTKNVASFLKTLDEKKSKKILLVVPGKIEKLERAARNLKEINLTKAENLNVYDVLSTQNLMFLEKTVEKIKEVFGKSK